MIVPKEKECHCGEIADKYYTHKFMSEAGYNVIRIFYKCRNCKSRIFEDFCPELDSMEQVDVIKLIQSKRLISS